MQLLIFIYILSSFFRSINIFYNDFMFSVAVVVFLVRLGCQELGSESTLGVMSPICCRSSRSDLFGDISHI